MGAPSGRSGVAAPVENAGAGYRARRHLDPDSRRWLEQLDRAHPSHHRAVTELHGLLRRAALHELSQRRSRLRAVSGPEFADIAQQAADDAVLKILDRLADFRGLSRFTTWAYKFVMFEISAKVARHPWQRQAPEVAEGGCERLADSRTRPPEEWVEQRAQLRALSHAIGELTERQRDVFVAIALNEAPVEEVAARLYTSPNAVYKNLFDARKSLRARLTAAGHPVGEAGHGTVVAGTNGAGGARHSPR